MQICSVVDALMFTCLISKDVNIIRFPLELLLDHVGSKLWLAHTMGRPHLSHH